MEDKPKDGSSDFPSFLFADFLGKGDDVWKRGQKQNGISEGKNVDVAKQSDDHQQIKATRTASNNVRCIKTPKAINKPVPIFPAP